MRRLIGTVAVAALLSGCSLMQGGSEDAVATAAAIGQSAGTLACLVVSTERPQDGPALMQAVTVARAAVTGGQDVAALLAALDTLDDPRTRAYVVAGVSLVTTALHASTDAQLDPDSPLATGLLAMLAACEAVGRQPTQPA